MNWFIPFLMLIVPGIIAVSIHNGQLIHVTRDNWQSLMWMYLFYSLAIIFVVNFILFLRLPQRSISFSSCTTWTTNNVLQSNFIVKYTLLAVAAAFGLPKLWARRHVLKNIGNIIKKRKSFTIGEDE